MSSLLEFLSDPQSERLNWVKLVSATHSTDEHRLAGLHLSPSRQPVPLLHQEQGHIGSHPPVPVDIIHYSRSVQLAEMLKVICKNTPLCYRLNPCVKLFQLLGVNIHIQPGSSHHERQCPPWFSSDSGALWAWIKSYQWDRVWLGTSAPTQTLPHTIWNDSERFWPVGLGCVF